ncbi:hypothetical protein LGK95_20635 [Clostridium algoriphilum]|uniref:hypothetical protein n=1 Tax=Clostridium algoriphilum TaxID=198347 RepID=UPI001CF3A634|nr:hypothetical protein [Clostridium algoriphilum]MCB2295873.1 hypothetical protein [Clostridium algoriphilum]
MWKIAEVRTNKEEPSIVVLDKFGEKQIKELLHANSSIEKIKELYFIKNNFDTAYKFYDRYFIDMLKKNAILEKDIIVYNIKVFLYSGLEFIDTCEKLMGKLYPEEITKLKNNGKKKNETFAEGIWKFKEFVKSIYDDNFSYRLCYNLRNCLQHVGSEGLLLNKDKHGYHVLLNKQQYMNSHSGIQKNFAKELKSNSKTTFDIIKFLYSYNENINSLFKMVEKYCEEKIIIDTFEANYSIFSILGQEEYNKNKGYVLIDIAESIDKNSVDMNFKSIDIAKSIDFVDTHCKIFKLYGKQTLLPSVNQFPHYVKRDNVVQIPILIIGDSLVKENLTWKQTYSSIGLGSNNYFSIYVPLFFSRKIQAEITNIVIKKLNIVD